ncbi:MAG: hypothetical protein Q7S22_00210 [Candidatus Micrarchaeota archaeon]|nr:hypothetical protein [Candidatus Micrarchaeota archaeon]
MSLKSFYLATRVETAAKIVKTKTPSGMQLKQEIYWPKGTPSALAFTTGMTEPSLQEAVALTQPDAYGEIKLTDSSGATALTVTVKAFGLGKPEITYIGEKNRELALSIARKIKRKGEYWFMPLVEEIG